MSNVKTYIEIKIIDKDGKVVKEVKSEANSFVRNFIRALYNLTIAPAMNRTATMLVDIYGRENPMLFNPRYLYTIMDLVAPIENDDYGILVGRGTNPVSYDDYELEDQITYLDIYYGEMEGHLISRPDGKEAIVISRTFTNSSSGDVTIREVGLAFHTRTIYDRYFFLIDRTVLSSPITLKPGQSAVIRYIITA
ncbi:MAG: hypothetical protein QXX12_08275 [Nanopusillaceae archaeon]